jgi:hypothetical protein
MARPSLLVVVWCIVGAACPGEPPPPECTVDDDCGFETLLCRDERCVDRDTEYHRVCCACFAEHACFIDDFSETQCNDNLNSAQQIDVDAACADDEARCASDCEFLAL